MNKLCVILVMVAMLGGCASVDAGGTSSGNPAVTLRDMITQIQSALVLVGDEVTKKTNLELHSASLTLNTELNKSAQGGADLWLVSSKASTANATVDKVTITLVPMKHSELMTKRLEKTLSERLAAAIVAAVEGVSKAGEGKYPMAVEKMVVAMDIKTTTSASAGGGVKFEVLPVSLTGTGSYSKSNENVLTLEFDMKK